MRIISDYKDYYDGCQKYGIDKSIVYIRKQEEMEVSANDFNLGDNIELSSEETFYNNFLKSSNIIGFCGKLYPYFNLTKKQNTQDKTCINNIKDMCIFVGDHLEKKQIENFYTSERSKTYSFYRRMGWFRGEMSYDIIKEYFKITSGIKDTTDFFNKYKVPVFAIEKKDDDKYRLTLNPNLRDLSFVKLFNPYQTYQEIEMFISGVIGIQKPQLVNIGNEDMLHKKGFDKWSFRKQSTKKKPSSF